MQIQIPHLEFDEFLRIFSQNSDQQYSFLLGAGCSISSGIPSASRCIWDWKKNIYQTNNTQLRYVSIDSETDRKEIQRWCNLQPGFPQFNSDEEYSFYIEKAFSEERDRISYFERLFDGKVPSVGYKLLALLAKFNIVQSVWTTNFDNMTLRAAESLGVTTFPISIETKEEIYNNFSRNGLKYVALHGDYKYSKIKNTGKELDSQETVFVNVMSSHLSEKHLIVMGYSGRDKSLMSALKSVYSRNGGGRLFWLGMDKEPADSVGVLISEAQKAGRSAYYIQAPGFDEAMHQMVALACGENDVYKEFVRNNVGTPLVKIEPFKIKEQGNIIKYATSNLFPVIVPEFCYSFNIKVQPDMTLRDFLNQRINGRNIVASCYNGKVYAIGAMSELHAVFADCFSDRPSLISVTDETMTKVPIIKNLFLKAILLGVAKKTGLNMNFRGFLWDDRNCYENRKGVYEALKLSLHLNPHERYLYLSIVPTVKFDDEVHIDRIVKQNISREYSDRLRNKEYLKKLCEWTTKLFNGGALLIRYSEESKEFTFKISHNSACCKIFGTGCSAQINPLFNLRRLTYAGIQVPEPILLFSSHDREYVPDTNPMRGLGSNRPFDLPSFAIPPSNIPIGVICPRTHCIPLYNFLVKLNNGNVTPRQLGYVQNYTGFASIYGVALDVPFYQGNSMWITCKDEQNDGFTLAKNICKSIEHLSELNPCAVVVIFIPNRWSNIRSFNVQGIDVDFHDYIKAYSAQKGITTQFIEEKTINNSFMGCEILWWLSLAVFVKSGRTPWTLGSLNNETAYAGIGYSIQQNNHNKIVVGCSHIYNSHGQGLKFRLKKIDNAIFDRKNNPYLTKDEAYKLGLNIVELFSDSMYKKPQRVVIHKRTIFKQDEITGLVSALAPYVQDIELITIEEEKNYKLIPSYLAQMINADNYPVNRGTCVPIDDNTALLWTHGSLASNISGRTYYQGGKGIPMPLRLTRCYGISSIDEIASEILSFTKINWNSFYFYSKLPATIETSNVVANIGGLLQHYNGNTFDYKYFI